MSGNLTSIDGVYTLTLPRADGRLPLVFDSPHSGSTYPGDFDYACPHEALARAEDCAVDQLFGGAPAHGAALLSACFPRTYIDVNRAEDDIDTELLAERWPGPLAPTQRSYAGIGLIRRLVRPGQPVYDHPLRVAEVQHRIAHYYRPYHAALKALLDDAHYHYGQVWHINCHSMPATTSATSPHGILSMMPDIVLGDRDGTSCDADFTRALRDALRGMGYKVAVNNPYKGVEIVRRSANPAMGRHSIQIEISKRLYWDEDTHRPSPRFKTLQDDLERLMAFCASYVSSRLVNLAAD